jgi:hypothetical protein
MTAQKGMVNASGDHHPLPGEKNERLADFFPGESAVTAL